MADLTDKQRAFVEHYLVSWNASDAARQAGYAQAHSQGPRLLENVGVQAEIQSRFAALKMTADEVVTRLTEHARADIREVFTIEQDEDGTEHADLDLVRLMRSSASRLVKSVTYTKYGPKVELHDAQAALVDIGKIHGLFKDVVEIKIPWDDLTEEQMQRIANGEDPRKVLAK